MGGVSGPLLGIVRSTVNFAITIVNTCSTLREMRVGNEILENKGPFDATLHVKCPIFGTYLLTESESSTLYAFLHANAKLGDNWMKDVERQMVNIRAVVLAANALQLRSPFQLSQIGANGNSALAKGDHFLNTALRRTPARLAHEAALMQRRDPKALTSLIDHAGATRRRR